MRKTLLWLISAILFSTLPAIAQRGQHQQSRENHNVGVRQRGNGERPNVGVRQRGNDEQFRGFNRQFGRQFDPRERQENRRDNRIMRDDREHEFHERHEFRGYHWGNGRSRDHWNGRRFDNDYFGSRWGRGHRFYWNHCQWYGPRYYPGSYFWYNGVYFVIVESVPSYWNDEEVYVEYYDGYGYALVNPMFPGVYYHVDVRF